MKLENIPLAQEILSNLSIRYIEQLQKTKRGETFDKILKLQKDITWIDLMLSDLEHEGNRIMSEYEEMRVLTKSKDLEIQALKQEIEKINKINTL